MRFQLALPSIVILLWALSASFAPLISPSPYSRIELAARLQGPSAPHWLGTDDLGRDVVSRMLYGGRVSLAVTALSLFLAATLGTILGAAAGYLGGGFDLAVSRAMDILLALPGILLAISIVAYVGRGFAPLVLALSATAWVGYARLVRSLAISLRHRDFVEASRAMGASTPHILRLHILPNTFALLAVQAASGAAAVILAEASLSFLGLGVQPPYPSWGETLATGCDYLLEAPHLAIASGTALFAAVWSLYALGEGLSDRLDPRRRLG